MTMEEQLTKNAEENNDRSRERANRIKVANMIKGMSEEDKRYILIYFSAEMLLEELTRQLKIYKETFGKARELFRVDKIEGEGNAQADLLNFINNNY